MKGITGKRNWESHNVKKIKEEVARRRRWKRVFGGDVFEDVVRGRFEEGVRKESFERGVWRKRLQDEFEESLRRVLGKSS